MADAFEEEAEQTVTINEYIEGLEAEELEADMVLGGDEGKECTYPNGYMKRQAIFSCLTCVPAGNSGVCTACSLSCHDGHEVVELWTKRKFRCDCGNSKFGVNFCKLCPDKEPENLKNTYNHNFKGSYCICGRPYPDPEAKEQVEMIQCCICEDWFHEDHLGLDSSDEIPRDEEGEPVYDDFICKDCASTFSFLKLYPDSIWALPEKKNTLLVKRDNENVSSAADKSESCIPLPENHGSCSNAYNDLDERPSLKDSLYQQSKELNQSLLHESKELSSKCILPTNINLEPAILEEKEPMFLVKKWRDLLCKCKNCYEFYTKKGIDFLIDKDDSIEEYEKMATKKREEKLQQQEGAEMNFLNRFDHVQKIEILSGIADMKNELHSFLEGRDPSKPVTSEDVRGVFENLAKKRQRLL